MKFLLFILAIVIIFIIFSKLDAFDSAPQIQNVLQFENVRLNLEIADTDEERIKGLSGREMLEEGTGLLFVFEKEGYHGFWMKDMNFPIDIAWIDQNKKINHIESNVSPDTYPKIFNPDSLNLYVLETNANFFEKSKIKIGDQLKF